MTRLFILFLIAFHLFPEVVSGTLIKGDSIDNQILYNGRLWRNLYHRVVGDQFLFTSELLEGSVTIEGMQFKNVMLRYDIFQDELLAMNRKDMIILLNREKIDNFTLSFNNRQFDFIKLDNDSINNLSGYVNILLRGEVSIWVKYRKEIVMLGHEGRLDKFNQVQRIFLVKEEKAYQVKSKRDILRLLNDQKQVLRDFMRKDKSEISKNSPDTFIPVILFYNKLNSAPDET
ncbi:MAG: hypothetical protein V1903_03435 [Bacteroidota bacterium]